MLSDRQTRGEWANDQNFSNGLGQDPECTGHYGDGRAMDNALARDNLFLLTSLNSINDTRDYDPRASNYSDNSSNPQNLDRILGQIDLNVTKKSENPDFHKAHVQDLSPTEDFSNGHPTSPNDGHQSGLGKNSDQVKTTDLTYALSSKVFDNQENLRPSSGLKNT